MATVKSWAELTKAINKKVAAALENEVKEEVKSTYLKNIESDVYDSYSPTAYNRRGADDGLLDPDNIVGECKDSVLEIRNVAVPNESIAPEGSTHTEYSPAYDTQFAAWIERGEVYNGKAPYIFTPDADGNMIDHSGEVWAKPRPFTQHTIDELKATQKHKEALKEGLKKRGVKTE